MKKEMTFTAATAILFVAVAAVALFVWHSWYLYCGAVLTGYAALTLLTVILNRSLNVDYHYFGQYINDKSRFYGVIAGCYAVVCLLNVVLLLAAQGSMDTRLLLTLLNMVTAWSFLIFTIYCCEGKDWCLWFIKAMC